MSVLCAQEHNISYVSEYQLVPLHTYHYDRVFTAIIGVSQHIVSSVSSNTGVSLNINCQVLHNGDKYVHCTFMNIHTH